MINTFMTIMTMMLMMMTTLRMLTMTLFVSPLSSDFSCELCPAVTALSLTCSALVQYNDNNAMQRSTNNVVNYSELQCNAVQCNNTVQCSAIQ